MTHHYDLKVTVTYTCPQCHCDLHMSTRASAVHVSKSVHPDDGPSTTRGVTRDKQIPHDCCVSLQTLHTQKQSGLINSILKTTSNSWLCCTETNINTVSYLQVIFLSRSTVCT